MFGEVGFLRLGRVSFRSGKEDLEADGPSDAGELVAQLDMGRSTKERRAL